MRRKVWFSPVPGIGLPAVVVGRSWLLRFPVVVGRDQNGRCFRIKASSSTLYER